MKIKELSEYSDGGLKVDDDTVLNDDCNIYHGIQHYKIVNLGRRVIIVEVKKKDKDEGLKLRTASEVLMLSSTTVKLGDVRKALGLKVVNAMSVKNNGTTPGYLGIGDGLEYSDGTKYKFIRIGNMDIDNGCFMMLIKWPLTINNVEEIQGWSGKPVYVENKRRVSLSELEQIVGKQYMELFDVVKYDNDK